MNDKISHDQVHKIQLNKTLHQAIANDSNMTAIMKNRSVPLTPDEILVQASQGGPEFESALQLNRQLAEHGHPEFQYSYAQFLALGVGGLTKDTKEAFKWFSRSAEQGYAPAMTEVGRFYMDGAQGIPRDDANAVYFLRRAAVLNESHAMVLLGRLHEAGLCGFSRDMAEAAYYYRVAADAGNADGHLRLSDMLYSGANGSISVDQHDALFHAQALMF